MSTQFTDGSFSQIKLLAEAREDFENFLEAIPEKVHSFHVGTAPELLERQKAKSIEQQVHELSGAVKELQQKQTVYPHIVKPTEEQLRDFLNEHVMDEGGGDGRENV